MAEAAAALGVAAAAVQFFDFGLKALALCKQIRDSEKGATEANQELEGYLDKLKQITNDLRPTDTLRATDRPITKARNDCVAVIDDLQKLLDDFKLKSRNKNLAAVKSAFRAMRGKRDIEVLRNKLSEAQKRFAAAVSVDTRNDVARLLEEQGKTSDTIQNMVLPEIRKAQKSSASSHAKTHKELLDLSATSSAANALFASSHAKIHNELSDLSNTSSAANKTTHGLLKEVQQGHEASGKHQKRMAATLSKDIAAIEAQADKHNTSMLNVFKHKDLLDSLRYPEMFDRQQSIKPPSFGTFEWIFSGSPSISQNVRDSSQSRDAMRGVFARWLESNDPLFWISGKAGSGKSSLMSLIQDDRRTAKALSTWTEGRQLYTFSFYFWRPGTALQKSIHGLLRSFLYQLVKAKPSITDLIMSAKHALHNDWTTRSLLAALQVSLPAFHEDRVFLMVDGLDEYEDQYTELLDLLLDCQHMIHVKTCLASRPETAILAKLRDYPSLRLQDLNAMDIETFVNGKLGPLCGRVTEKLIRDVVRRADGVFLWAVLVTKSMESGALAGDDTETLQLRLESTPVELNALFEHLFSNVDKVHYDTLSLCLFHLNASYWTEGSYLRASMGLITASMYTSKETDNGDDLLAACPKVSERVVAQCKGLIEVRRKDLSSPFSSAWVFDLGTQKRHSVDVNAVAVFYDSYLHFVHRSAYDFIFGDENKHDGPHPRTTLKADTTRLAERTLDGMKLLLQHGPVLFKEGELGTECFSSGVHDAIKITRAVGLEVFPWLDDLHNHLPIWYPPERSRSPTVAAEQSSPLDDWEFELGFWCLSLEADRYVECRLDRMMQGPHLHFRCSVLLFNVLETCLIDGDHEAKLKAWLPVCQRLLAFQSTTANHFCPATIGHWTERHVGPLKISWDRKESADSMSEQYAVSSLSKTAMGLMNAPECRERGILCQDLFAAFQRHNVYLGLHATVPRGSGGRDDMCLPALQIQTDWVFSERPHQSDGRFRFICLFGIAGEAKRLSRNSHLEGKRIDADVVGVFEVSIDSLRAVQVDDSRSRRSRMILRLEFPRFKGTREDYYSCLEQLVSKIREDEDGQLSAWPQLYMLACVKKFFKDWWEIVTPTPDMHC